MKLLRNDIIIPQHLATGNKNKVREFKRMLWWDFPLETFQIPDLPEIQETDVVEVVKVKARAAAKEAWKPVLVEDSWFGINAYPNQFPWALYKFVEKWPWNKWLLSMMSDQTNREVTWVTAIAFTDDKGQTYVFKGKCAWTMPNEERWDNGFGYDTILIPDWFDITLAEMTDEEKDTISMRRKALEKFLEFAQGWEYNEE